jgi:hypothetical protein
LVRGALRDGIPELGGKRGHRVVEHLDRAAVLTELAKLLSDAVP